MSSTEVLSSLRGKVLKTPQRKVSHGESTHLCEIQHEAWSPYNSNLQMQGIKVIVKNPVPKVKKGDAFEDTMLLIDMMKQQKEMNNQEKKETRIRELALEQKRKREEKDKGNTSRYLL
eukprot:TRINITY_DN26430_c0_g1_i1.p1 TRINITY_DN26430_c0_g1~~TRINITY_DN26430_c0_g1_i1.p1  ORF type:complete len:118 (+),score=35.75 TRINITY_DN26430_c0_g1_i1:45-398(+)